MSHNSNHRDAVSVPDRAAVIAPARKLHQLHERDARWKLVGVLWWALVLVCVSAALSLITGNILTRLMPNAIAYLVGTIIHLAIGFATHLLVVGAAQRDRQDKAVGLTFLAFGLGTLLYVSCFRAFVLVEEGRAPVFAVTVSIFLLLLEVVVPALWGYVLAKAWLARNKPAEEERYFRHFAQMIETSTDPMRRWNDAEDRLADEIVGLQGVLSTAKPEEQVEANAEIARRWQRLNTLREWNPTRPFARLDTPAPLWISTVSPVGHNGRDERALAPQMSEPNAG